VSTFEVDHPITAAIKRARVQEVFGRLPAHVRYVDLDFNRDDLARALRAAGYRHDLPAFVIWSGVTAYLESLGVDAVLRWFARAQPGSSIVFDYAYREVVDGDDSFHGASELRRRVASGGEPLRFGIPRGAVARFIAERGLELVSDLAPEELRGRYLVRSDGRLGGQPYGFVSIAHARVS
jgi:methyltransferase (TIGR00027 family)